MKVLVTGSNGQVGYCLVQQLRQQIGDYVACPIPSREAMTAKIQAKLRQEAENVQPIRFMPGAHGPSW